ncbi:hypothetical protein FA014_01970 [Cellulomonas hominis]|uniref:Uncharacterized protein n=1 Tax=Cellulomonas hominis TaxID=156981 RepID=A0A7Z8K1X3_9CELL|nr:hypothetical protein [Cellulomonas hominis]TKR27147.1 hypothetical protein FA014_01970 [Cellulomonas hominis]
MCPRCTSTLRGLLTDLPGLFGDLDVARTRQARWGSRTAGASTTTPLPFALEPADARWVLLDTLLAWLDWVTAVRAHRPPATWAEVEDYLVRWRGGAVDWLARHPDGAAAVDELTAALRNARRAIDSPARRLYAGPCTAVVPGEGGLAVECGTDLLAAPGSAVVECRSCGTAWPLAERRSWLLERAEDVLLPAAEIARAVDGLGLRLSENTLRSWVRQGRLVRRGRAVLTDGRTAETYRVGDVLDLVHAAAARRGRGRRLVAT